MQGIKPLWFGQKDTHDSMTCKERGVCKDNYQNVTLVGCQTR